MGKIDFWLGGRGSASAAGPAPAASGIERLLLMQSFEDSGRGWFWSTDDGGRLSYLSASVSEALGVEDKAALGQHFTDFFVAAEDDVSGRGKLPFILSKQAAF